MMKKYHCITHRVEFYINLYIQDSTARSPPVRITTRTREELNIFFKFLMFFTFFIFYYNWLNSPIFPPSITFGPLLWISHLPIFLLYYFTAISVMNHFVINNFLHQKLSVQDLCLKFLFRCFGSGYRKANMTLKTRKKWRNLLFLSFFLRIWDFFSFLKPFLEA